MDDSPAGLPTRGLGASSGWVLGGTLVVGLASTSVLLILAGLLTPREFGYVTVAVLVFEVACMGLSPGLAQAYHSLGGTPKLAQNALALAVLTGTAALLLGVPLAPLLTGLLGVPEAAGLTAAALIGVPLRRWNEVRIAQFENTLTFSQPNAIIGASAIAAGALAVGAALLGAGPWALLIHLIAHEAMAGVALAIFGPYPRMPRLDRVTSRQILRFSRRLLGDSILVYGYTNLDDAVVARVAGPAALGAYSFAYRLANLAALATARPAQRVLLPVLTRSSVNEEETRHLFLRSLEWLSFLSALACSGVGFLGPLALSQVYGERWDASHVPLQIFATYAAFRAIGALTGTVFLAAKRPGFIMRIAAWQLAGLAVIVVPATLTFGVVGAAAAVTLPLAVGVSFALRYASNHVGVPPSQAFSIVLSRWVLAIAVGGAARLTASALGGWIGLLGSSLLFSVAAGTALFAWRRWRPGPREPAERPRR